MNRYMTKLQIEITKKYIHTINSQVEVAGMQYAYAEYVTQHFGVSFKDTFKATLEGVDYDYDHFDAYMTDADALIDQLTERLVMLEVHLGDIDAAEAEQAYLNGED